MTRATTDILNVYGREATGELVEKVGRMIGDYLQFEKNEDDSEMYGDERGNSTPPVTPSAACT